MELALKIVFLLSVPLLFIGLINRIKSSWAGRKGPPILQPVFDIVKLMRKGEVISTTTSFVFRIAPSVVLGTSLCAALFVPVIGHRSIVSFDGDFIVFAYLLGISRFFSVLLATDTGSSFEGMGAARELTFSVFVEPAFFILVGSLAAATGYGSFQSLLGLFERSGTLGYIAVVLGAVALFIMLLTEGCRVPVDDPNTHLELTMIHEVIILDASGPDLGFILYASGLKMVLIGSIIAALLTPLHIGLWLSLAVYVGTLLVLASAVGTIESLFPRFRMSAVPQFIFLMMSCALVVLAAFLIFYQGGIRT